MDQVVESVAELKIAKDFFIFTLGNDDERWQVQSVPNVVNDELQRFRVLEDDMCSHKALTKHFSRMPIDSKSLTNF